MKSVSNKRIPALRFKDDRGEEYPEWTKDSLGNIANFRKGKGISKGDVVNDGNVRCIRYGELYTHYGATVSRVLSRTNLPIDQLEFGLINDVLIPASGETALDIATVTCLTTENVALGGDINIVRSDQNGIFLAYYLISKKKDIARLAQGISVIHLYSTQLKTIVLNIPSKPEQQKIADFLSSTDTRIEQLKKKKTLFEQFKKGLLQKLFSQKIRFRDDQGKEYPEWEEKRLRVIFSERNETGDSDTEMLSVTIANGVVRAQDLDRRDTSPADKSKYKKVVIGDIPYNSMRMWQGASGVSCFNGIVSPAYTVIVPKDGQVSEFWGYYFKLIKVLHVFQRHSQGLTSDTWNLKFPALSRIKFLVSIEEEQQKIADFLSSIDRKIELLNEQIDKTKDFKRGLLQQMFV